MYCLDDGVLMILYDLVGWFNSVLDMRCLWQVVVVYILQSFVGVQYVCGVSQYGQGWGVILGGVMVEGWIGDNDVDVFIGYIDQIIVLMSDDVELVCLSGEMGGINGLL